MKQLCPVCEQGILKERKETVLFNMRDYGEVEVKNFEFSECSHCDSQPILPEQAKRNDGRIRRAKRNKRKEEKK